MYSKNGEEKTADCIFVLFHKYQTLCECNCDTAQYSQKTIRNKNKTKTKIFLLKKTICLKNYVIQIISFFTLPSGFVLIMTGYKKNPTKQLERR